METDNSTSVILTPKELLDHWQGHRRLTRRVIESFPEEKLFNYSIGGMRPFAEMVMEMISMAVSGLHGVTTGEWKRFGKLDLNGITSTSIPETKGELLKLWDWTTEQINKKWSQIPKDHFQETDIAFDQYEGKVWWHIFYFIDNEIHHRGQGYVYLRSLDIEPPYFWER